MRLSKRFINALFTSSAWWVGIAISVVLHLLVTEIIEEKNRRQFEYHANNAQLSIQTRVRSYMDVLRATSALFQTLDQVRRDQFHSYVEQLDLAKNFPGINNLNFAPFVSAAKKESFINSVRKDTSLGPRGYPEFSIKPPGERAGYHVLTYIEPMEGNESSFGLDMTSNARSENALLVSRDSGQLTSSGRLIRISGPDKHVGMAMRIPLYRRGMPLDTVAERRAAYFGSVGAGFNINKLMLGAVDANSLRYMQVKVYDAGESSQPLARNSNTSEHLLFDTAAMPEDIASVRPTSNDVFLKRVSMAVGPRVWEAEFIAEKSAMATGIDAYTPWLVLIGGLIGSTLLFSVYYSLMTARRRAVELASEMTRDLRISEESLAEAQHMARLGSWTLEPESGKMAWSAETQRIFGITESLNEPMYDDFLLHIEESDRKKVREGLERTIRNGEEFTLEHRITQSDGSMRWVQTMSRLGQNERGLVLRGTIMDISERKHAVEQLRRSQELLRELTAHQDRVKEDERKRIAREIHDELGQTLLALRIDVSMLDARTGKTHPKLNQKVRDALGHIDATVKTIRTIINNLRPAVLDLGLSAAIEWQVAEFRRRTGIDCDLVMSEREFIVDDMRATSLFRILQESLSNVIRHANASHVLIELRQENDKLVMKITDNGVGIYPGSPKSGNSFGLVGVEERIHALNGEFHILSAPGEGTTLTFHIPLSTHGKAFYPFKLVDNAE